MVEKLCRLNQRYYWQRNFLLEQISSHISFIVTFCEPFLFPDIALYTIGTIVSRTSLTATLSASLLVSTLLTGARLTLNQTCNCIYSTSSVILINRHQIH